MTFPDPDTRLAAVVGHPVSHSFSPAIHNAALRRAGRNGIYLAFDVAPASFGAAVAGLRVLDAVGINVTLPHKEAAAALADVRSPAVETTAAANTLLFTADGVRAENSDVVGVLETLRSLAGDLPRRVLVLGAGGSARAAVYGLASERCEVVVTNRTDQRARALVAELAVESDVVAWERREDVVEDVDAVVNCTSVGLGTGDSPLSSDALRRAAVGACRLVLDLVYGPSETVLVRSARAAGLVAADGLPVLVRQAAAAYEWMWNAVADVSVMDRAAAQAAGRDVDSYGAPAV